MLASTTRLSLGGPRLYLAAPSASKRTTWHSTAPTIQTVYGQAGCRNQGFPNHPRCSDPRQFASLSPSNVAAATTRENAGTQQQRAATHIAAQTVGAHILACSVPAEGRGVTHAQDHQSILRDRWDPLQRHHTLARGTEDPPF